jgi:metallo-beta-lactamase class B
MRRSFAAALFLCGTAQAADPLTQPWNCELCAEWNQPVTPFRIYGNSYYVGVHGLASVVIATSAGLILLDGDLPQSAPLIEANLRSLGFKVGDIRLILNSHTHSDHAGGIAALQRDSGAQVVASPSSAEGLRLGHAVPDDPQFGYVPDSHFPALRAPVRLLHDGEELKLGDTAVTAHFTPGHTPGGTTWTWKSCQDGSCLNLVYADSLNAVAAPGFRYSGDGSHPDTATILRASIDKVAALPCDIVISVHPELTDLWDKLAARRPGMQPDPMVTPGGCRSYADDARKLLERRLAEERGGAG